ncbi:gamma-glutamyltransferase family protein [Brevundimonas staleyi]|uniref:Gamma-glutamyltransferase family protein n=1 Tax=Brevundimonas staleyi TaxID=74326 RepID=A0ABW0FV65_9CAUL
MTSSAFRPLLVATLALSLVGCQTAPLTGAVPTLVAQSPATPANPARGPFVAAANPLAVEAGMAVLRRGGSAVDAAVAVQAVLGLVEPQSSGLGGGAFLMVYDAETKEVTTYDGRETAPADATPELFYENGRPLPFMDAVLSGRSTGAPGAVAALALAQQQHGTLAWSSLFGDAERLARDGFTVSPRLAGMIAGQGQARTRWATEYFTKPDGTRYVAGDTLRNPAYADTVATIARDGIQALRTGPIAEAIVEAVHAEPRPGSLSAADLAGYRPIARDALCRPFRVYVVCIPPPPSSGVALLQLLAMAETPTAASVLAEGETSADAWTMFAQLQRLMYADRDRYVADPAFVGVPVAGLLDPDYVAERAALAPGLTGAATAGTPPGGIFRAPDATNEPAGTSHLVVVDAAGNAVSMTTTVESIFGSGRMAGGFFLNNQLTDFSFSPTTAEGQPIANAVAAGKRPRSTMSPVIILDQQGRLVGALGSPGGGSILAYNAKGLIGTLVWGLPIQAAFDLPNLVARGSGFGADTARFGPSLTAELAERGIVLQPNTSENSGLHGGIWKGDHWDGGADDRREGVARTE